MVVHLPASNDHVSLLRALCTVSCASIGGPQLRVVARDDVFSYRISADVINQKFDLPVLSNDRAVDPTSRLSVHSVVPSKWSNKGSAAVPAGGQHISYLIDPRQLSSGATYTDTFKYMVCELRVPTSGCATASVEVEIVAGEQQGHHMQAHRCLPGGSAVATLQAPAHWRCSGISAPAL